MNIIILVIILFNTTCHVVDWCIIPYFGIHLTRAEHFMSYLHDIINI